MADLLLNPAHPSFHFHKIDKAEDPNFWSARAGKDLRIIVHKQPSSFLIAYVDHHDKAYAWAARRKVEPHSVTRAMQIFIAIPEIAKSHQMSALGSSRVASLTIHPPLSSCLSGRSRDSLSG